MALRGLTPKQELFAQLDVELGNGPDAYRGAYNAEDMADSSIRAEVSKLRRHPLIAQRIKEIRADLAKRHEITVDSLAADLEADRALAYETRKASAAVSATKAKAQLLGLMVDRKEIRHSGSLGADDPLLAAIMDRMTEEDLAALEEIQGRMDAIREEIEADGDAEG